LRFTLSNGDDDASLLAKKIAGSDTVEHVWITIKEVQLHSAGDSSDNGWKTVATPDRKFDFLNLVNGLTAPLDLYALPAGHYTQIRLILAEGSGSDASTAALENSIVINGTTSPLLIPSSWQTGIKCVRSFFIKENETTEICLAFDVWKAIHYSDGNGYMMRPTYRTYKCDGSAPDPEVPDPEIIPTTDRTDM
jgi:hypothetical protein